MNFNSFDLIYILQTQKSLQDILDLGISKKDFNAFKEEIKASRNYTLVCVGDTYRVMTKTAWERESLTTKVVDMYNKGMSVSEIAKGTGEKGSIIHSLLSRSRRKSAPRLGAEEVHRAMKEGFLSISDIADLVKISLRSVIMAVTELKKAGMLPASTCIVNGEIKFDKVRHEKLPEGETAVNAVKRLKAEGFSNAEIATKINRSKQYITATLAYIKKMEGKASASV